MHREVALSFVAIAPVPACRSPACRIVNLASRSCPRADIRPLAHAFIHRSKHGNCEYMNDLSVSSSEQPELQNLYRPKPRRKKAGLKSEVTTERANNSSSEKFIVHILNKKKNHTAIKFSCTFTYISSTCVRLSTAAGNETEAVTVAMVAAASCSPPFTKCPMNQPPWERVYARETDKLVVQVMPEDNQALVLDVWNLQWQGRLY